MAPSPSHSQSLLPNPDILILDRIERDSACFRLLVHVDQKPACPICGRISRSKHSGYGRRLQDFPWQGISVELWVTVSRFRCRNTSCPRKVFCERSPQVARACRRSCDGVGRGGAGAGVRYYALREAARFDDIGLWSHNAVWFSRYGTLVSTIESFVNQSPNGWFADELAGVLHAEVQDPLHDLVRADRLRRSEVAGRFLYTSADGRQARDQLRTRQTAQSVPLLTDASALQVSPDELKAAILLFYSLLDEQQRRLFAGLESIKLGHGGDSVLAEFLGLDPHTVARGRQQLLDQNVSTERTRRSGGGRKPIEKKPPTSSH